MYSALVFLGMHIPPIVAPAFQWRSENAMSYSKYKPVHYGIMGVMRVALQGASIKEPIWFECDNVELVTSPLAALEVHV